MSYANEQVADTASQRNPEVDGGGAGEKWAITKVRQVPVPTLRPLNKFNYGRVSMLAHVRTDALRVDTGGPGRNAYMGSKEAVVRALVDYRGG